METRVTNTAVVPPLGTAFAQSLKPRQCWQCSLLTALVLTLTIPSLSFGATRDEERTQGMTMLQKANADRAEARRLSEVANQTAQTAERERIAARAKLLEAINLQREALLLLRDANKLRAAQLRDRAEVFESRLREEQIEKARLTGQLNHDRRVASDTSVAATRIQDAIRSETNPAEKAELTKMAESLSKESTRAAGDADAVQQRLTIVSDLTERLSKDVRIISDAANKLDPTTK